MTTNGNAGAAAAQGGAASGGREGGGLDIEQEIGKKGEGTFSEVLTCRLSDGRLAAVKRMKSEFRSWEQVNSLREVQALRRLNPHPNIIDLYDVKYDPSTRKLDLICELMDMNIYERIKNRKHHLPEALVKVYIYQLCKSLDHMHRNGIFHRDVKPENILIKDDVLKLADFGSCRGIYSKPPFTEYISTRWYRPPECLLTDGRYSFKMDMWSVGCVFFEVLSLYPLFPGQNELDQISKIHDVVGTPSPELLAKLQKGSTHTKHKFEKKDGVGLRHYLPQASAECVELMEGLLMYDPEERFSARQALKHPYFREQREADKRSRNQNQSAADIIGAKKVDELNASTASRQRQPGGGSAKQGRKGALPQVGPQKTSHAPPKVITKTSSSSSQNSYQPSSSSTTQQSSSSASKQKSTIKTTGGAPRRRRHGKGPAQPQSISLLANKAKSGGPSGFPMTTRGYGPSSTTSKAKVGGGGGGAGGGGGGSTDSSLPPITFSTTAKRKPKLAKGGTKSYNQPGGHLPKLGGIKKDY